ncbi:hypothetical protein BP5796_02684 [Coleophoma crateriformis]|uniref:NB-ARC domain-containing protein n=1 Tax=Coleophoma crateriformis TaxID=565419 RepID=A0A3D8SZ38_9HELO|nr:hypothetical protein BP5796_02684 [Coleophoma crateriformis]
MSISPPFAKIQQLCTGLDANDDDLEGQKSASLPGRPWLMINDPNIAQLLEDEVWAEDLEALAPHLWVMSTQSSKNVNALHRQRVKGREIIVTEEPRLHLVWFHDRIFIKPLPRYLLSYRFWELFLIHQPSLLGNRQEAIRRAALGYLRTYRYLIRHESDFFIAQQEHLRLVPQDIDWVKFHQFISAFDVVKDVHVSHRYHYGEVRLSRLNLYAPLLLRKFHFEQIDGQYGDYFARLYGPILFIFALVSTILSSMQVELAMDQVRTVTEADIGLRVLRLPSREPAGPPVPIIDIVAIHGIGAHPDDTWCKKVSPDGTEAKYVNWLKDDHMLPSIAPNARILRYGYESRWFGNDAIRQKASDVAKRFLIALRRERKALLEALYHKDEWPGVFDSTTGLIFFGTPFRGAGGMKLSELLEAARREYEEHQIQTEVLRILEPGNEFLQDLVDNFGKTRSKANKALVTCFYELKSSNVGAIVGKQDRTRFVVNESSGCLDLSDLTEKYSLSRTHFNMNKFGSPDEEDFLTVRDVIEKMVEMSPKLVLARSQLLPPFLVPFTKNSNFVGRSSYIKELDYRISSNPSARVAIFGLGGVGKTQIALHYAYQRKQKSPCAVFWVSAVDTATFEQAYLEIAKLLNISGKQDNGADIKALVRQKLSTESYGEWLLIIDNADNADVLLKAPDTASSFTSLLHYLPSSSLGSIIFTTPTRKAAQDYSPGAALEVKQMEMEEARQLFRQSLLQKHIVDTEATAVIELLDYLTYLPLAITQAAAYINKNDTSVAEYLSLYDEREEDIIKVLSKDFEHHGRYHGMKNPVATTWLISFEQISLEDELAVQYLSFMSAILPDEIPRSLLPQGESKDSEMEAIGTLTAYSFISRRDEEETFDMHRLVYLATRSWLRRKSELLFWEERALERLQELIPAGGHVDYHIWIKYLPHGEHVVDKYKSSNENNTLSIKVSDAIGRCYYSLGLYSRAEKIHRHALALREKEFGLEDSQTLISMNEVSLALSSQGKHAKAEAMHRATLDMRETVLGKEHPDTLMSRNNLEWILHI